MHDQLSQIDTSSIDDLQRIKVEEDELQVRLDTMLEKKGKVSEIVYQRVRADYEARYAALEDEARPLKGKARGEYSKLLRHHSQLEATVEAARLDKEELDFRRELGEFTDAEYDERLKAMARELKEREKDLGECDKVRKAFLEAFHSEEELLRGTQDPATPKAGGTAPKAKGRAGESDITREVLVRPASESVGEATMIIPPATLIVQAGSDAGSEVRLGLQPLTIGRASGSDLRLDVKGVSSQHAEISVTGDGFEIRDHDSRKGLYVNGERVSARVLANGDLIELGSSEAQLIFRSRSA